MRVVYLLHFSRPLKHARHYLGFTKQELAQRIKDHQEGRGSRLTQVAVAEGIELWLVRVWADKGRDFERYLKNLKNVPRLCPLCRANKKNV